MGGIAVGVEGSGTAWESVFNLGNCAIGAGILSFPYAFWLAGIGGGLCLCLVVATIEYFTLNIIARQSTLHGSITYQGLVRSGLGQVASEIMSWTILAFIFGSCVAYIIIVGDNFGAVMKDYVVDPLQLPPIFAARQVMIIVLGVAIMLPISLQRSMVALAPVSTIALAVMTLTTGIIVLKVVWQMVLEGPTDMLAQVAWFKFDLAAVGSIPVMVFAYHCHVQSVPIYYELTFDPALFDCVKLRHAAKDRRQQQQLQSSAPPQPAAVSASPTTVDTTTESAPLLPQSNRSSSQNAAAANSAPVATAVAPHRTAVEVRRKLFGMARVLAAAYAECTVLYLSTGIAGYLLFPKDAQSNILKNFPADDHLMQVMRFLVGFAVLLHYPINQHVARSALYDLICHYIGATPQAHVPYSHVAGLTVAFFAASVGTACVVSDLGIVFQVIGGLAGSLLVFVLPGGLVVAHCRGRFHDESSDTVAQAHVHEGSNGAGAPMTRTTSSEDGAPRARRSIEYIDVESQSRAGIEHRKPRARSTMHRVGSTGSHGVDGSILEEDEPYGGVVSVHSEAHPEMGNTAMEYEPLGWALIALGACVFVITMYITFVDTLGSR